MSAETDPRRLRAAKMVERGLTDQQIDREIMYSDHADRLVIWKHVHTLREERGAAAADVEMRIFAGKQLKARVIELRNARLTSPEIAVHPDVKRSRQRVEQILAEAKTKGWTDPLDR